MIREKGIAFSYGRRTKHIQTTVQSGVGIWRDLNLTKPTHSFMDCCAYCTASSYKIKPLYESLKKKFKANLYRDVVHIEVPAQTHVCDVFYFAYGATICWGMSKEQGLELLTETKNFEDQPHDIEVEEFTYLHGETPKVKENEIVLPNDDVITKLAFSYGLAQTVKLSSFEVALQKTFNNTKRIPEELAKNGRISLSKEEIRRKMGALFIERSSISLHVDVLDTPEFFWEYPELEPLYMMIASDEDLEKRSEVLNRRLGIVHELFEMLGNELNHQHSSRLEWIIIWLIIIEVVLTTLRDVFQIL